MFIWLLTLTLAKPPPTEADVIDGQWRAMQVLRVRPEAFRVIKEPILIERGPLKITLTEGVMIPIFSGFHEKDKDGIQQARAEAFALDSKAPPPLAEGDVAFVGFVFAAAKGQFEVSWQERADSLIFANHQVTHLNRDRADWLDVAHGAPWIGEITEGMVIGTDDELRRAFVGPDDPKGDPNDVVVYGERDYTNARIRARILFHDRRATLMRNGFHAGRGVAWDRVAEKYGLAVHGHHTLIDLHIDQNLGAMSKPPGQQPNDIDWMSLLQDWTGTLDRRRHSVLSAMDLNHDEQLIDDVITGVPFPPSNPEDPTSAPQPSARLETAEAYVVVQAVPVATQIHADILARLKLNAIGGDFQVVQLDIPRSGSQHDWRLVSIDRADGVPLISRNPLVEYNPAGHRPAEAGPAMLDLSGRANAPQQMEEGTRQGQSTDLTSANRAAPRVDTNHNGQVSRVTLSLPEPVRAGESLVIDVKWTDKWPYGDAQFVEQGSMAGGISVVSQTAQASGPQSVIPRPAGSGADNPVAFQIQVVVPERTELRVASAGVLDRSWEADGYRHTLSKQLATRVPYAEVHVGSFTVHDEQAAAGMPAVRTRTFGIDEGKQLARETRAQIQFLQGFLPPFPWTEHEVALGPGGVNNLWWSSGHGITGAGIAGVTSVTDGGALTRQTGANTTQMLMTHELAHQWFGQSLRPADRSDAWFTETFAEVFGALYLTTLHGGYDQLYARKRRGFETLLVQPVTRVSLTSAYESPYQQAVLFDYGPYLFQEMLRPRIGNDRYHAAIDLLARDFAGKAVTSEQIEAWFSAAAERDLGDFFDFWVYGGFLPKKVGLRWEYAEGLFTAELDCDVPFGSFDVPVVIDGVAHWVALKDASGRLELPLNAEPQKVELDPEHRILAINRSSKRGL